MQTATLEQKRAESMSRKAITGEAKRVRKAGKHQGMSKVLGVAGKLAVCLRAHFICCYCGADLHEAQPREITIEHLIARSQGGSDEYTNLTICCVYCNSKRSDSMAWDVYAPGGAIERIKAQVVKPIDSYIALAKALIKGDILDPR